MAIEWKGKSTSVCVLGFQDPDLTEVSRDSLTLSAASEALIIQWVASRKYRLISGDIKTAFLSGDQDVRNIFISPPDDVRQMLNVDHETVLRLRKTVYGLINAPKKWWDRLKKSLIQHEFTSCALDPCAFVLRMNGKIHGVLGVHVDDVIGSGDDRIMTAVRNKISQMPNGEIVFDMEQYTHELEQIEVSKADKTKPERILNSRCIPNSEEVLGVWAGLWITAVHNYHFSWQNYSRKQSSPTVQDLLRLNKVIRTAKVIESKIKIRVFQWNIFASWVFMMRLMQISGAGASQQGHLILAVHASITNCRVPVSVLSWQSKKIKRVVRSSLAAETCSMSTFQEHLDWKHTMWEQMTLMNLCSSIMSSSSRLVPTFLSLTARAFTMQYTKKEQLQRQQTRDWRLSLGSCLGCCFCDCGGYSGGNCCFCRRDCGGNCCFCGGDCGGGCCCVRSCCLGTPCLERSSGSSPPILISISRISRSAGDAIRSCSSAHLIAVAR